MTRRIWNALMFLLAAAVIWNRISLPVMAAGDISVVFDVPDSRPLFELQNMSPGDESVRHMTVRNGSAVSRTFAVRGILTSASGLEDAMIITISKSGNIVYPEHLISEFVDNGSTVSGIALSPIRPGETEVYSVSVRFGASSGNTYQGKRVTLDLFVGYTDDMPSTCTSMKLNGSTLYGTDGSDRLKGTSGNDLIIARGGNDVIDGGGGNDCIVSESGTKIIFGGPGNDEIQLGRARGVVFGDTGDDIIAGGNQSIMDGGLGQDTCVGGLRIRCERDTL